MSVRPGDPDTDSLGRIVLYLAAWLAAALPAFLIITLLWLYFDQTNPFAYYAVGAFALAFPVIVRRLGVPRRIDFVYFLLLVGIAFGILSVLTGWGNGLTDEPYTTPRFAYFLLSGHDPYTQQLVFTYQQYGRTLSSQSYYLYLPLLMFLQIPGISYKWFTLGCWALMVLLVRRRFDTAILLAQPYVLLIAASGYNDLPVLLLLTLGFVGFEGRRQKWAEYLSLGCKQFANAFVVVYYLVRRRWVDSAITLGVTLVFLLPFLIWGGSAVVCRAIFADRLSACTSGASATLLLNYPVWVVWVFAVFYLPLIAILSEWSLRRPAASWLPTTSSGRRRVAALPAQAIVAASAVATGLVVYDAAIIMLGSTGLGAFEAGVVGIASATAWSLSWNGSVRPDPATPSFWSRPRRRLALSQLVAFALALLVLGGWIAFGREPLTGAALALVLGVTVGAALIAHGDLLAPDEERGDRTPPGEANRPVRSGGGSSP